MKHGIDDRLTDLTGLTALSVQQGYIMPQKNYTVIRKVSPHELFSFMSLMTNALQKLQASNFLDKFSSILIMNADIYGKTSRYHKICEISYVTFETNMPTNRTTIRVRRSNA